MNHKEDRRYMGMAHTQKQKATCIRMGVGAVIVSNCSQQLILGKGFNGPPGQCISCASKGCVRIQQGIPSGTRAETCRGLHAEQRALLDALEQEQQVIDATLYCTHFPCSICAKLLIGAGIMEVVYREDYPDDLAKELFAEAGVTTRQYKENL